MQPDLQALAAAQSTCQDTQSYRTAITGMTVADVPVHEGGPSLLCDTPSKYVFVRVGPQHPSLQRPYQGPFKVIQTGNKTFKVLMNKGPQTISVDRLKPAKVSPQTQTRAGRIVNEPDRWHY